MWLEQTPTLCVVAGCLGVAGCAVSPPATPRQLVDMPIASAYADATFTLNTLSWRKVLCAADEKECPAAGGERFSGQIRRVAGRLQEGAWVLYPDLDQQIPNVADGRFAIYAIDADGPGSSATADGRIALNSGLAAESPDDAWIAFVIAREMGHVIARHPEENSVLSLLASLALNVVVPGSGLIKTAISTAGSTLAASSKEAVQAREAETIALRLLKVSGYPLHDVARSLQNAPPLPEDNSWVRSFRKSSDKLMAEARDSEPQPLSPVRSPAIRRKPVAVTLAGPTKEIPVGRNHAPNDTDAVPSALTRRRDDRFIADSGRPP